MQIAKQFEARHKAEYKLREVKNKAWFPSTLCICTAPFFYKHLNIRQLKAAQALRQLENCIAPSVKPDHIWYSFNSWPIMSQHFLPISKFIIFIKYQGNSVQTESFPLFFVKLALNSTNPENSCSELKHRVLCEKNASSVAIPTLKIQAATSRRCSSWPERFLLRFLKIHVSILQEKLWPSDLYFISSVMLKCFTTKIPRLG